MNLGPQLLKGKLRHVATRKWANSLRVIIGKDIGCKKHFPSGNSSRKQRSTSLSTKWHKSQERLLSVIPS